MNNIYKKIKISWTYPIQSTSLQVGTVKIYRGTSEFTLSNVLSQTELVTKDYDPSFTEFIDDFELQENTTYYYMIIVYGDTHPEILAATELYTVSLNKTQDINSDFDYLVVYYSWNEKNGIDLDTRTSLTNPPRNIEVGWDRSSSDLTYLEWTGDNTSQGGSESVLINLKDIKTDFPQSNKISILLKAFWYNTILDGNFVLSYKSFKGGSMAPNGYSHENTGGILVDSFSYRCYTNSADRNGDLIGSLNFDLINNKGSLSFIRDSTLLISAPSNLRASVIY